MFCVRVRCFLNFAFRVRGFAFGIRGVSRFGVSRFSGIEIFGFTLGVRGVRGFAFPVRGSRFSSFRVHGFLRFAIWVSHSEFRGSIFRGSGFRVRGSRFRVRGSGFSRFRGSGFSRS